MEAFLQPRLKTERHPCRRHPLPDPSPHLRRKSDRCESKATVTL